MIYYEKKKIEKLFSREVKPKNVSDVILYEYRTKGTFYHNCSTGKCSYNLSDVIRNKKYLFLKRNSFIVKGFYAEYDKKH